MRQFVSDGDGHKGPVHQTGAFRIVEQTGVAVDDQTPVLHGHDLHFRQRDEVDLGQRELLVQVALQKVQNFWRQIVGEFREAKVVR